MGRYPQIARWWWRIFTLGGPKVKERERRSVIRPLPQGGTAQTYDQRISDDCIDQERCDGRGDPVPTLPSLPLRNGHLTYGRAACTATSGLAVNAAAVAIDIIFPAAAVAFPAPITIRSCCAHHSATGCTDRRTFGHAEARHDCASDRAADRADARATQTVARRLT